MENGSKVQIPDIGKQTMSTQRDERKGAGVGLLAKLGLGGGAASSGAGGLAAGGGLLAGKAGVVALILAGSSVAAGIGMLTMGGGNANAPRAGASLFARAEGESAPVDSAETARDAAAAAANAGGVSGSLDNFNSANKGAVVDPYAPAKVESASDPASEQPADAPAAVPDHTTTESAGTAPPKGAAAPKMVKSSGFGSGASSSGGSSASGGGVVARAPGGAKSNVTGAALAGSSAMRGGGLRGATGARRSAIMKGGGASSQLRAHSQMLKSNLGSGNISSAGSGAVMDGAGQAGSLGGTGGAIAAGGQGAGGAGVDSSPAASTAKNLRDVSPPPEPIKDGKNVTGYQKYVEMGIAAIAVSLIALLVIGIIKKKIQTALAAPPPISGAAIAGLYTTAKVFAGIATVAAAAAVAMGVTIMQKFPTEKMPGMILTGVGALLTFQAGYKLMNMLSTDTPKEDEILTTQKAASIKESFEGFKLMETLGLGGA